jgi:hypothetical protein
MSPPSVKGEAEEDPARARSARSSIFLMQMKGFGKVALVFVLLGGLMAYFIIPVQFSRKRALSPADKAEYALTVNYYESHCGPVLPEIEERAKAYARESGEDIWAGFDALLQHRGRVIGSPMTWCRALAQALCIAYTTQHGSAPASQAAFLPRPAAKIALLSP